MVSGFRQEQINLQLAQDVADARTQVVVLLEVLNVFERLLDGLITSMVTTEALAPDDPAIDEYRKGIAYLRKNGFTRTRPPDKPPVACPSCKAVLRNVEGKQGDRCDWCGYEFAFRCPSCKTELRKRKNTPGEKCPYCKQEL